MKNSSNSYVNEKSDTRTYVWKILKGTVGLRNFQKRWDPWHVDLLVGIHHLYESCGIIHMPT